MASATYKIDPNGDTVIILRSPANPEYFALWDDSPFDNLDILGQLPFSIADEVLDKSEAAVHQASSENCEITNSEHTIPDIPVGSVLYHVSSAHLRMASPVFRKMLSPDAFREGHRKSDDRYYINADDWEEEVFLLFLNMLHLRSRKIPQRVDLELSAKIGIIVDYYDCGDAVEFFTTSWVYHTCAKSVTPAYSREVLLRLWVSYVFRDEHDFFNMTHIAISYCNESHLRTLDLPIPQAVLKGIEYHRTAYIKERLSRLYTRLQAYQGGHGRCSRNRGRDHRRCNTVLSLFLEQEMLGTGLQETPPAHPYEGFWLDQLNHCPRVISSEDLQVRDDGDIMRHLRRCLLKYD